MTRESAPNFFLYVRWDSPSMGKTGGENAWQFSQTNIVSVKKCEMKIGVLSNCRKTSQHGHNCIRWLHASTAQDFDSCRATMRFFRIFAKLFANLFRTSRDPWRKPLLKICTSKWDSLDRESQISLINERWIFAPESAMKRSSARHRTGTPCPKFDSCSCVGIVGRAAPSPAPPSPVPPPPKPGDSSCLLAAARPRLRR